MTALLRAALAALAVCAGSASLACDGRAIDSPAVYAAPICIPDAARFAARSPAFRNHAISSASCSAPPLLTFRKNMMK